MRDSKTIHDYVSVCNYKGCVFAQMHKVFVSKLTSGCSVLQYSRIPHTNEPTQGCGVGLADVKLSPFIDITLFDTQT